MTLGLRRYFTIGIATLAAGAIVTVSPPSAMAEGEAGGSGTGALTGPGGTTLGTVSASVVGKENIPNGAPGTLGCLTGGCSGSLTTAGSLLLGPGGTVPPAGLQITPTVNLPQPNAIACLTATCHGNGGLTIGGGITTPIVGATGGFNGYIHG